MVLSFQIFQLNFRHNKLKKMFLTNKTWPQAQQRKHRVVKGRDQLLNLNWAKRIPLLMPRMCTLMEQWLKEFIRIMKSLLPSKRKLQLKLMNSSQVELCLLLWIIRMLKWIKKEKIKWFMIILLRIPPRRDLLCPQLNKMLLL